MGITVIKKDGGGSSSSGLQGTWDASTNTPTLANTDTEKTGFMYQVSVGGTVNFGAGNLTFEAKDIVINNGTIWDKVDATDAVLSVNGDSGVVVLDADDISDTSTTNKFTTSADISKLANIENNATANPNAFDKVVDDTDDLTEGASNKFLSTSVQNQILNLEYQSLNQFVSTWKTNNGGTSGSTQITLPLTSTGTYDFIVEWGDGEQDRITTYNQSEVTHTYPSAGTYTVLISGVCDGWRFGNGGDKLKILDVKNCGCLNISNNMAFSGCNNLVFTAQDELKIIGATNLEGMFQNCFILTRVPFMDTSSVTNMYYMFALNVKLTEVPFMDTSSVTNMQFMFYGITQAVLTIPMLNMSSVTSANAMFIATTLSTENYSNFLIYLDSLTLQNNVNFHGGNSTYNTAGGVARANIISNYNWSITDGGAV
jgi:hypothetical protein